MGLSGISSDARAEKADDFGMFRNTMMLSHHVYLEVSNIIPNFETF